MALNKDFRIKDSLYVGASALFAAGGTSYDGSKVAIDTYGVILSGGRDLALLLQGGDNAKYDSVYTTVNTNSAKYDSTYTSLNANSAQYDSTYTSLNTNSANYDSTFTSLNTNSAKYDSAYTSVNANSGSWDSTYTSFNSNSAGYDSTYTTVNTNSAKYDSTYTSLNANSAKYDSAYTSFNVTSASTIDGIAEGTSQGQIAVTDLANNTTQVDVNGLQTGDSPSFAGVTAGNIQVGVTGDNEIDTSSGDLTIDSATGQTTIDDNLTVSGDTTIQGSLSVVGSFTYLDTTVSVTSALEVENNGTGPALVVNQTGAQPVINFKDDGVSVLYIEDGGNVGIGTTDPDAKLSIAGTLSASSAATIDGDLAVGSFIKQYITPGSSTYKQDQIFTGALTLAGSPNTVTTFAKADLETAKYIVSLYNGGSRTACEVLLIYNGTNAYGTVYGLVDAQGTSLLTDIDVSVSGSTVDLTISVSADCSVTIHGSAHY